MKILCTDVILGQPEHTSRRAPVAGMAFLGAQGDIWDAQIDMLVAGIGAITAMSIVMLIRWSLDRNFLKDLRKSFILGDADQPMGEVEFLRLWHNHSKQD